MKTRPIVLTQLVRRTLLDLSDMWSYHTVDIDSSVRTLIEFGLAERQDHAVRLTPLGVAHRDRVQSEMKSAMRDRENLVP